MTEGTRTLEVDGGELPPPPPPATTPPAQMTQVESQRHADAMAAEALRLATEAAQLNAAAVLMRAMSAELERHQLGLGGVGDMRGVMLGSEIPMAEGDEGGSQVAMMELDVQVGASRSVSTETQVTETDGGTRAIGEGGGRLKRGRSRNYKKSTPRGGKSKREQGKREQGRRERRRDGEEG